MSVVLATAGYDHKIRFWIAPSGICSRIIKYPDSQVNRLQITPDKQFIAAAGNPVIRLYEILTSTSPEPATAGGANGAAIAGSTTAGHSITSPQDQQHQQQSSQQAVLTLEGHTNNVTSIGFQKDGRYLYSGSEDGTIKIWDLRNPHYSRSFNVGSAVNSVTLRQDDGIDEFISGDYNGYIKIWDLGGGSISNKNGGCINSIRPCAGSTIISGGGGGGSSTCGSDAGGGDDHGVGRPFSSPSPFDEASSPSPLSGTQHSVPAAAAPAANGNNGGDNHNNNKTTTTTTRRRHQYYSEGYAPIQAVDISEDSRTLVAISNHGTVFVWDPTARTSTMVAGAATYPSASSPSPLPDNHNDDEDSNNDNNDENQKNIRNHDEDMAEPSNRNNVHDYDDDIANNNDDDDAMMTMMMGGSLLRPITKFRAHAPGIYCLHGKIAPDCRHLVTTGSDGTAKLWDTTTWELTQTLHANNNNNNNSGGNNSNNNRKWVWDAAFCADSSYLMTASSDHVARLWNLRTGDVVRQYGHQSAVTCVALNDSSV